MCVGSRVLAKPLRFKLWGAREVLSLLPIYALARYDLGDELDALATQRHMIYTGSGHRCGVIPYSSLVVVDFLLG